MNDKQPVSFPGWKSALALSNLTSIVKSSHTREILTFLHHCKKTHAPVTVTLIKQWLAGHETAVNGPARDALRWFYRTAPKPDEMASAVMGSKISSSEMPEPGTRATPESPPRPNPRERLSARQPWRPMEPRPAAQDLGGPDWEQALVGTLRVRGLLSRTEDTYRSWSAYSLRHAAFTNPTK